MALNDKTQRVVLKFNVDAEGVVLGVQRIGDELTKVEKKAKESGKSFSDFMGGVDSTIEKLKRGFGDVQKVVGFAQEAFNAALEESRLRMGAAGTDMEGLRKASRGLKTEMDLLRDAVKFKSAAEKMSQQDMEDVEGAMDSLIRKGKDSQKVNDAITQALQKLSTEGLQELGIHVEKAGLSMDDAKDRAQLFARIMEQLHGESMKVADAELTKEERMAASGVAFEDAVSKIKIALGQMVVALAPLVEKVAKLVSLIPQIGKGLGNSGGWLVKGWMNEVMGMGTHIEGFGEWAPGDPGTLSGTLAGQRRLSRVQELWAQGNTVAALALLNGGSEDASGNELAGAIAGLFGDLQLGSGGSKRPGAIKGYKGKGERDKAAAEALAEMKRRAEEAKKLANEAAKSLTDDLVKQLEDEAPDVEDSFIQLGNNLGEMLGAIGEKINEGAAKMVANDNKRKSFMESAFGKLGEINAYKLAFESLTSSVTAGYNAMVDGTMSFGAAFKQSIAQSIKSVGSLMLVESLKEAAYAIAALARGIGGNPKAFAEAATHGKAALAFAAGAVTAGAIASSLGGGGGVSASGGGVVGAAAPGPRPANSNAPAETREILIVGDPFDTETNPRRRRNNAKKIFDDYGRTAMGGRY